MRCIIAAGRSGKLRPTLVWCLLCPLTSMVPSIYNLDSIRDTMDYQFALEGVAALNHNPHAFSEENSPAVG